MESTLIIGVLNPKGGSGKTTLATNLAHALQLEGREGHPSPVLIVDTDPQGTATDWQAAQGDGADLPSVVPSPTDAPSRVSSAASAPLTTWW